jgi:hypothetical protein
VAAPVVKRVYLWAFVISIAVAAIVVWLPI